MSATAAPLDVDPPAAAAVAPTAGGLRWVLDPDDDQTCLHRLAALHEWRKGISNSQIAEAVMKGT